MPPAERRRLSGLGLFLDTIRSLPDLLLPTIAALLGTRATGVGALPMVAAMLGGGILLRWLRWLRFHYTIGADEIRIEQGLLDRKTRTIPIDRIADVTIEQTALSRLLSQAVVRFDTGGGKGNEATLQYVSRAEADRLRQAIRSSQAALGERNTRPIEAEQAPAAERLFAMDARRILELGIYSFSLASILVPIALLLKFNAFLPGREYWLGLAEAEGERVSSMPVWDLTAALLAGLALVAAVGMAVGVIRTAMAFGGFRLDRTDKGLRRRTGLLTHSDITIPLPRIQAALIATGPIRRRRGWHSLDLISLGDGVPGGGNLTVAPLAQVEELRPLLDLARVAPPGPDTPFRQADPGPSLDRAIVRSSLLAIAGAGWWLIGLPFGWLTAIPAAGLALRDWLRWRYEFRAEEQGQLFMRTGWWSQLLMIAHEINVQSISITRGPLERRRGLATVYVSLVKSTLRLRAVPLAEALALRERVIAVVAPVDFSRLGRTT